jgi:hypothetical protein
MCVSFRDLLYGWTIFGFRALLGAPEPAGGPPRKIAAAARSPTHPEHGPSLAAEHLLRDPA